MLMLPITQVIAAGATDNWDNNTTSKNEYAVLAPLPGVANKVGDTTTLKKYIHAIFNLAIGLSAVAAVLMIVLGGFQYMSTDAIMKKEEGKKRIKNAIYGLILVISAWLILYTINPNLLKLNLNIESITTATPAGGTLTGVRTATGVDLLSGNSLQADQAIRDNLGKVKVNNKPCTTQRTSKCTNLNGLPQSMISSLKNLQKNCTQGSNNSCIVQISGGTETSLHIAGSEHKPGKSVVDLSSKNTLNTYLGYPTPQSGDTVTKDGLKFKYEVTGENGVSTGPHWHVIPP